MPGIALGNLCNGFAQKCLCLFHVPGGQCGQTSVEKHGSCRLALPQSRASSASPRCHASAAVDGPCGLPCFGRLPVSLKQCRRPSYWPARRRAATTSKLGLFLQEAFSAQLSNPPARRIAGGTGAVNGVDRNKPARSQASAESCLRSSKAITGSCAATTAGQSGGAFHDCKSCVGHK